MVSGNIQVVQCVACDKEILVERTSNKAVWPLAADRAPEDVPPKVAEAYHDAMLALAAGSKIGALMALRAMGIRLLRDTGVETFRQLANKGIITQAQYDLLNQNRLWANVIGHEDMPTDKFNLGQITRLFQFVQTILETIYTQPKVAERFVQLTQELKQNN